MPNGLDATLEMVPTRPMAQGSDGDAGSDPAEGAWAGSAGLTLIFAPGTRPDADGVARLIAASREAGLAASVSHRPVGEATWLELLASGLTFDLVGLAPGKGAPIPEPVQRFGLDEGDDPGAGEAIALVPSGHILGGAGMQPVMRIMLGLAANLVLGLKAETPVRAVAWGPARTLMEPRYFCRMVLAWLGGGAFPALGLTALLAAPDGSVASRGLAHFTGQEIQLEAREGESAADTVKLAVRVIDHLVRRGRLTAPLRIEAAPQALLAEPSQVGKLVLIWREDGD
ncbi:hypothetical protein [Novosphingobium resinovorum]|uniref:hypothetical protein n=1 Tax=Novosphingobium resinovorum TaxID=158500 RepID=UPI002ED26D4B|nr:hypothetical protein [Novosphingobium resinovorum]